MTMASKLIETTCKHCGEDIRKDDGAGGEWMDRETHLTCPTKAGSKGQRHEPGLPGQRTMSRFCQSEGPRGETICMRPLGHDGPCGWERLVMFAERLRCSKCGKSVSSPVPANTVVRAWIQCPECIEAEHNDVKTPDEATFVAFGEYLMHSGAIHDDGCPCDDTCDCSGKRLNDGANDAYKFLAALRAKERP